MLAVGVSDDKQWDIQPLGAGYTIRKVASTLSHAPTPLLLNEGIGRAWNLRKTRPILYDAQWNVEWVRRRDLGLPCGVEDRSRYGS